MNAFALIKELDKRIEFHRRNTYDPNNTSHAVIAGLIEVRNSILEAEPPAVPATQPAIPGEVTYVACPFCGDERQTHPEKEKLEFPLDEKNVVHFACCRCCGAQGPLADSQEDAEKLWRARWAPGKSADWREFFREETT